MTSHDMNPVAGDQRLIHLDVLRGFALLGILLVNFEWFNRPLQAMVLGADPSLEGLDRLVDWGISWLAEGKFYPLFSMLFGAGFALMLGRAEVQGRAFRSLYLRRLLVLASFGALHILLFWSGDVLLLYAFCGLGMMVLFRDTPTERQWKWALAMIAGPLILLWLTLGLTTLARMDPEMAMEMSAGIERDRAMLTVDVERAGSVFRDGSFVEVARERVRDYGLLLSYAGVFWLSMVFGFFLLGRWLVCSGLLVDVVAHRSRLRGLRRNGLIAGLVLAAVGTSLLHGADVLAWRLPVTLGFTLATAASIALSLGYLATVVLASERLRWLAPAGRMALTNYLLQSIFWTSLFYGYGLGLWGQIPRLWHPVLVVVFFALQVIASHWWLNRFRFGPVEWLWRSLTYWRLQPMRNP